MKRLAFVIAAAALLVSAPRLALAFLLADGVALQPAVEAGVYAGTGIASGLVLTGGNVYLAHALAEHYRRRGALWFVLLGSWVLFLIFTVILIAPSLVAGLQHSALAKVLETDRQRWGWAVTAALSVEVLAAAAMAASVLSAEPTAASKRPGVGSALSGAAVRWLERVAPGASAPSDAPAAAEPAASAPGSPAAPLVTAASAPASEPASYPCRKPTCQRTFGTPQARNAHEAKCKPAPPGGAA